MRKLVVFASAALFALTAPRVHAKLAVRTLADMVAAGHYDYVSPHITENNFPVKPERFTTEGVEVVHFDHIMSTKEVLVEIDRRGFRPATIEELLAYAKQSWNGKDWVVALGSSWVYPDGYRDVPYLYGDAGGRKLSLRYAHPEYRWHEGCLFLVVRKSITAAKLAVRTLADMIKAGHYDYVSPHITENNFPVKPERFTTKGVEVVHFDRIMSTKEVLVEIDRRGFRPATIEELLAYAKQSCNGKDWVVALGSSLVDPDGDRFVPYVFEDDGGRKLGLHWGDPESRWFEDGLFLAVRK